MTLSICICTSGRPVELQRCLASIAAGSREPAEVIVSDDSTDPAMQATVRDVVGRQHGCVYINGPCRGLCANRNHVIRHATGTHLSLLDDDAMVGADFVERATALVARYPDVILTGDVMEGGNLLSPPTNPTALGYFGRQVGPSDRLRNINLNCNVIPRAASQAATFDERITYGYEDTDWCAQALAAGFRIIHVPELVNQHLPPTRPGLGSVRQWQAERARFYVTIRRHARWDRHAGRLLAFLAIAPLHLSLHAIKTWQLRRVGSGWCWAAADLLGSRR